MSDKKRCSECGRIIIDNNSWLGLCPHCAEPIKNNIRLLIGAVLLYIAKKVFSFFFNRRN